MASAHYHATSFDEFYVSTLECDPGHATVSCAQEFSTNEPRPALHEAPRDRRTTLHIPFLTHGIAQSSFGAVAHSKEVAVPCAKQVVVRVHDREVHAGQY